MGARRRPTAVFCANDLLALGLLQEMTRRAIEESERQVSEDAKQLESVDAWISEITDNTSAC